MAHASLALALPFPLVIIKGYKVANIAISMRLQSYPSPRVLMNGHLEANMVKTYSCQSYA